ncbi:hypothetical protein K432DRAFT_310310 [Lepidopterella palustris CBS 459.81]|uniref:Uncharacterized protein n=1 Tax=Lepidopterella palustris CBS 459.81 TaxID=1314670 RepID=A0A8E2J9V4_9PEZI|nr:hypothetical protein K432DRAFT_310310 [Lepidopterella palustris CBS 459.81]
MEASHRPPPFAFPNGQPTSPPATPGSNSHSRFPSTVSHTSPIYKRMGLSMLAQSPPLEFIEPIGHGPQFHFTRPQSRDFSSQPSSASGRACAASPGESEADEESDDEESDDEESDDEESDDGESDDREYNKEEGRPVRRVENAEFVLEELESDPGYDSDTEVVRPDQCEEANSEKAAEEPLEIDTGIIRGFSKLQCAGESNDEDEQRRSYRKKKKRWSAGIFKRSHSQSVGSDTDIDEPEALDAHDVGSSARRLRRRVRGPGDNRWSLNFEDIPNKNIIEVEEPNDGGNGKGPPSIPSDDGFTLDELPFWVLDDPMDVDLDSS